jgi:hypothetical protein
VESEVKSGASPQVRGLITVTDTHVYRQGASPRWRGVFDRTPRGRTESGFIPAGAGRTFRGEPDSFDARRIPAWAGRDPMRDLAYLHGGRSPHGRGLLVDRLTVLWTLGASPRSRSGPSILSLRAIWCGASPRRRGVSCDLVMAHLESGASPRRRGGHRGDGKAKYDGGSSPRMRGQVTLRGLAFGEIGRSPRCGAGACVHWRPDDRWIIPACAGHAYVQASQRLNRRCIPASAGRSRCTRATHPFGTVHPRLCGGAVIRREGCTSRQVHLRLCGAITEIGGKIDHVQGTPPLLRGFGLDRFGSMPS